MPDHKYGFAQAKDTNLSTEGNTYPNKCVWLTKEAGMQHD